LVPPKTSQGCSSYPLTGGLRTNGDRREGTLRGYSLAPEEGEILEGLLIAGIELQHIVEGPLGGRRVSSLKEEDMAEHSLGMQRII